MPLSSLVKGPAGHPWHPPLTDATIGSYTAATVLVAVGAAGIAEDALAAAWWIVLILALGFGALAAVSGFVDWLTITWGTPMWRTATVHALVMVAANGIFGAAAIAGYGGYQDRVIETAPLALALAGFAVLTLGGWLGGSVVYVHGMRVLSLVEEPARRAATPGVHEKEEASP